MKDNEVREKEWSKMKKKGSMGRGGSDEYKWRGTIPSTPQTIPTQNLTLPKLIERVLSIKNMEFTVIATYIIPKINKFVNFFVSFYF